MDKFHLINMEKIQGKYYSRFKDESWEKALARNNGFDNLLEAVQDSLLNEDSTYTFLISDFEGKILFDSANFEEDYLESLALVSQVNRYFIKASYDASLAEAVSDHPKGFSSEQDAINDMEESLGDSRDRIIYTVYLLNDKLEFVNVHVGQVGNL